jgi:hypothetical protein
MNMGARPGNLLGLAPGQHIRLFDAYIEAREQAEAGLLDAQEAMSTSDFPTYIGSLSRHTFLDRFQEISGSWTQYSRDFSLEDFESWDMSRWGRFPDIEEKPLNGPYNDIYLKELPGENLRLREWGNTFGLTRQLIISDRLNEIAKWPRMLGESLARTMSKVAAIDAFQSNPTMFDGNALFSSAHANLGAATALTSDKAGMDLLKALELKLDTQTDDEGYKVTSPGNQRTLIIPVEYRWIVNALMNNDVLPDGSGNLIPNEVKGRYAVIEERYFTDANNYYMSSDLKGQLAFLAAVTLNGNTTPFIGVKDGGVRAVLGGNDPYSFEFDEIAYKIRHDFNFKPVEWRGIVGALPA